MFIFGIGFIIVGVIFITWKIANKILDDEGEENEL